MEITINLAPVLSFILGYAIIGMIAFLPLAIWQNRFISGNRKWHEGIRWFRTVGVSIIAWPIILGYNIKTEIDYRKKGFL